MQLCAYMKILQIISKPPTVKHKNFSVRMRKCERNKIKIEAFQAKDSWMLSVRAKRQREDVDLAEVLKRVKEGGATLFVLDDARLWIEKLHSIKAFPKYKIFTAY